LREQKSERGERESERVASARLLSAKHQRERERERARALEVGCVQST
jgi:hypothetical protein